MSDTFDEEWRRLAAGDAGEELARRLQVVLVRHRDQQAPAHSSPPESRPRRRRAASRARLPAGVRPTAVAASLTPAFATPAARRAWSSSQ